MHKKILILAVMVAFALILASCAAPECPECPEAPACPECEDCPEAPACPECEECEVCEECETCPEPEACPEYESILPGIEAAWTGSGHAASDAEAFRHWDEDDPAVVALACAKCHSTAGYVEFLSSGEVTVETPAEENQGIQCVACHNQAALSKDSVVMPSGIELAGLGDEARCMECHQGRHSTVSVNKNIAAAAGVEIAEVAEDAEDPVMEAIGAAAAAAAEVDADTVFEELGFANIHYFPAAATKYGTFAKGGYEYPGKTYDGNFAHVEEYDTCIECHSPHTLEVQAEGCVMCHGDGEISSYRMEGSAVDYDGDGDIEEGIAGEINGLQEALYTAIQAYASTTVGTGIVYDAHSYPYFFIDGDGDGAVTEGEAAYPNKYAAWTPRLLRAAYNYQMSVKDPGAAAHGGKYIIQLLYDSIEDLGADVSALHRNDHGHFMGSAEAFRHWDEDGAVSSSCAKCHSATGLQTFAQEGVNVTAEISNGMLCETCHSGEWPGRLTFESVTFPSGASVTVAEGDESGLCMQCHQGRSSTVTVDGMVADLPGDEVAESLRFSNVHYFAAGASRYGTEVKGGYEFAGKEYAGFFPHVAGYDTCTSCHDAHVLEVKTDECFTCHAGYEDTHDIRMSDVDYDGDGDVEEGIAGEVETMAGALYEAIKAYSAEIGFPVIYDSHSYPYFFADSDGDGEVSPGEGIYPNRYSTWTPNLLEAAYNYQYALKDPGGFAHNGKYVLQLIYDSIEAVGGDVSGLTRP